EDFGRNHLFYRNEGEIRLDDETESSAADAVKYYTKFATPQQYLLADNNISFVFLKRDTAISNPQDSLHRIDVQMFGSNSTALLAPADTQNTCILNYFTEWFSGGRSNVRGSAAIICQSLWPNID